jgi:hypothetical protein
MTKWVALVLGSAGACLCVLAEPGVRPPSPAHASVPALSYALSLDTASSPVNNEVIQEYCLRCHNDRRLVGNMSLEAFDAGAPQQDWALAEKMIRKLRAGMMPPSGADRPEPAVLNALVTSLETRIDEAAVLDPDPGHRTFQRLNRAEYERSIHDLLKLEIDAGDYLPLDTKSANFDNIADVQTLSPTLLDAYLSAASEISRLAIGDPEASPSEATYRVPRYAEQREHVEGAPHGTRGGISLVHTFPADGEYTFRMGFQHESTGNLFGQTAPLDEQIEVSVNGERVALLDLDRWMHVQDPNGVNVRTEPIFVRAGPQRVSAAFIKQFEGPVDDLMSPHEWSLADKKIGYSYGITSLTHLRDLAIGGPFNPRGVSETPSRREIFTCRPTSAEESLPCAERILGRLATKAYRRPVRASDIEPLLGLFRTGSEDGGFEVGIRTALQGILASPEFVFRLERPGGGPGEVYPVSDIDLASRLSFFLWASPPDGELLAVARDGRLSEPVVLEQQVRRMVDDPRSEALATRFAAQWLRLQDLDKVHPDALMFPDFHQQLADDMKQETQRLFHALVVDDRPLLELLTADYTFANERLARHYGIPGVAGSHFRRVAYADQERRGILGHGSILTLTSHANRTSPVLRGKWVMEVLLGSPPPPPPPNVPELDATEEVAEGRILTVRERMELHRANPQCNSCHTVIDPLGLALENYDVTGRWRIKDNGMPIEVQADLYDGTPLGSVSDLRAALLNRPAPFVRTFIENLMAYATGRRVEYFDMPTVRAIERSAMANEYRMSSFIAGVVNSPAFRMSKPSEAVTEDAPMDDEGP